MEHQEFIYFENTWYLSSNKLQQEIFTRTTHTMEIWMIYFVACRLKFVTASDSLDTMRDMSLNSLNNGFATISSK